MNNHDLREILMKIQDRLSDNDRKQLYFLLHQDKASLDDTLFLTHPDHSNEENITYLIKLFETIQCHEAVQLLNEHINQTQSIMPPVTIQDDEKFNLILADKKIYSDNNNMLINSNNTNIHPVTVVLGSQSKYPLRSKRRHLLDISLTTHKCLLLLLIILSGLVIISFIEVTQLKMNYKNIINEQIKTKEIIEYLKNFVSNINQTIQQLTNRIEIYNQEKHFTEGNTCGCAKWCSEHGLNYGVCGNGHKCICRMEPITNGSLGHACTCDSWCRKRGYKNGGICGDGFTCICSK